jgi:hypothetical protein
VVAGAAADKDRSRPPRDPAAARMGTLRLRRAANEFRKGWDVFSRTLICRFSSHPHRTRAKEERRSC